MVAVWIVPALCLVLGGLATARLLPPLAANPTGRLAFVSISVLGGVVIAIIGLDVVSLIHRLEVARGHGLLGRRELVTGTLLDLLSEAGLITAVALVAYLVAPKPQAARAEG